jgi:putative tryptophan/tyrosine transport system substrate-binding protein
LGPGMHFDRLKRREVITLLGGAAAVWPLAASAQQQSVHPLIGVLSPLSAALAARNIAGFRSGLRDLGYLEGRDITLALRYGDGAPERMAPLAQELVALKPDVLMIGGARSGALAAQAAMRTIPLLSSRLTIRLHWGLQMSGRCSSAMGRLSITPARRSRRWQRGCDCRLCTDSASLRTQAA